MTSKESQAINIARFIFVIGVLFIHFRIPYSSTDGISLTAADTPMYNLLSSTFFLSSTCLDALFLISGYLFFKTLGGYSLDTYVKKIDGRIKSLVVPYMFWNVFWLGYNLLKTWKLQGVSDAELLQMNSIGDFFALFWEKGYGTHPDFPIAGYTWFLRDLFVFALLSPIYHYCYSKEKRAIGMLLVLLMTESIADWGIPGLNTWIYLGGFIATRGWSLETVCDNIKWIYVLPFFLVSNYLHFYTLNIGFFHVLLVISSFLVVMKLSIRMFDLHWLKNLAASSMYMYVTHILVLNIARHSLAKLLTIDSDMMMCVYYIINSSICVIVCITTYFLLKRIKANRLLSVMTGGRV